jgi:hypothetical protein
MDTAGKLLESVNLGNDGQPRLWDEAYHRWIGRYDRFGNQIESTVFGLNGEPALHKDGWHSWRARRDASGRFIETVHFGRSGEPAFRATDGSHRQVREFGPDGRETTLELGPNGRPRNNNLGWAKRVIVREGNRVVKKTFYKADADGKLTELPGDPEKKQ